MRGLASMLGIGLVLLACSAAVLAMPSDAKTVCCAACEMEKACTAETILNCDAREAPQIEYVPAEHVPAEIEGALPRADLACGFLRGAAKRMWGAERRANRRANGRGLARVGRAC